jgi:hypothetical protein
MRAGRPKATGRRRLIVRSISPHFARSFFVILALAVMLAPLGVATMAESHAIPAQHAENTTGMMMAEHCPDHGDSDSENNSNGAEDCATACSGVAVCAADILTHASHAVEVQSQNVIKTPHDDLPDFELPPPRIA